MKKKALTTIPERVAAMNTNDLIHFSIPKSYLRVRRLVEGFFLVLASPVILLLAAIVALVILIADKAPVFFVQQRIGKNGDVFNLYKFRTMKEKSDTSRLTAVNDERITPVGNILRRYKLDEIPQFYNVLKGDMSIIGPRPVPANFYPLYNQQIPHYSLRHAIAPGITGLAQLYQGYTKTLEEESLKLIYDLQYMNDISLRTDSKIIIETVASACKAVAKMT